MLIPTALTLARRHRWIVAIAATCSLSACERGAVKPEASQVVAQVNGQEISVHQINQVLRLQGGVAPEQVESVSRQVLERLVEQELAVQRAVQMKLDQDPAVMQDIGAARREVLARAYVARLADSATKPTADDVRRYYEANPGYFAQRRVFLLQDLQVLASPAQVDQIRAIVRGAKSLKEVSDYLGREKLVTKSSQITEGPESLPPAVASRLVELRDGQALMMPAPNGARIVVIAGSKASPITLEQATPYITRLLESERRRVAIEDGVKAMRQEGKIQLVGSFAASAPAQPPAAPASAASDGPVEAAAAVDASTMSKGLGGLR